jgi:bacillithiol biosynthesis deacetylase BshB1
MHPKIDLLAFAAHPDDVEISISGIMLKHKAAGMSTGVIDLTRGELGTRGNAELRAKESAKASEILQLDIRENLGFRDGFFHEDEEHLLAVIRMIRKYKPDIVLINAESDRHPDHGNAHHLVKRACFLSGLIKVKTEVNGEGQQAWRPQTVYAYIQDYYLEPDLVIDVTDFWEKRMESLMAYSSQFYNPDSNEASTPISTKEFINHIEGRSHQFGRLINCVHGEGLRRIRPLGVNLLNQLS